MKLSKQSQAFLEDLRLYLFTSGKNEHEIEEIISELKDHLKQAEANGKSVDDIIEGTPKEYMQRIAGEMTLDWKSWIKYIPILLICLLSYDTLSNALNGGIRISLLELSGNIIILILFSLMVIVIFKHVASTRLSKTMEYTWFALIGGGPIFLYIALIYLDRLIATPIITFTTTGTIIAILLAIAALIGFSIWSKTWITIIIPVILFLPDIILNQFQFNESLQSVASLVITFSALVGYLYVVNKKAKK